MAIASKRTLQDLLVSYGMERTIYRLSLSKYVDKFILKGGILLYALYEGDYGRSTYDIDLLAYHISNEKNNMEDIFKKIFSIELDDGLIYDLKSIKVKEITKFKEYHGVNVSIICYLGNICIPISLDIGFGDTIFPKPVKMDFPILLNTDCPKILAYSIYSLISEKFEAIVSLGFANSRFKDFYDIYEVSKNFDLNGIELQKAILETFNNRKTHIEEIVAFNDEFIDDKVRIKRWDSFIKKNQIDVYINFKETMEHIKRLLFPIVKSIIDNYEYNLKWNHRTLNWSINGE